MTKNSKKNYFNFNNKNALIIGGSGLIGSNIVKDLLKNNAKVYSLDIKKKSIRSKNISQIHFDCTILENIEKNFLNIINKIKKIDIFINCSYPYNKEWSQSSFDKINFKNLQYHLDVQLSYYSWLSILIAKKMKSNHTKGSIINLSSIYGSLAQNSAIYENTDMSENVTYSIIKGGIINLTRQMAAKYGKYGIRVNTISPGAIRGHTAGLSNKQDIKFIKNYERICPMKKLANPSEISSVAMFLSSNASSYINGHNLIVDGGWSII